MNSLFLLLFLMRVVLDFSVEDGYAYCFVISIVLVHFIYCCG
ncbi:hypothetical protein THOG11_50015 [Vibrio harveyi]|nr:hypothetical protein TH15OA1_510044 [Vibrio harveyi]CAH1579007.1 hypothetical protein THOG11_50015 [Vibrio harveyi]